MKQVQNLVGHHFRQNTLWKTTTCVSPILTIKQLCWHIFSKATFMTTYMNQKKIFVLKNKWVQINAEFGNALLYFSQNLLYEVLVGCWWCICIYIFWCDQYLWYSYKSVHLCLTSYLSLHSGLISYFLQQTRVRGLWNEKCDLA